MRENLDSNFDTSSISRAQNDSNLISLIWFHQNGQIYKETQKLLENEFLFFENLNQLDIKKIHPLIIISVGLKSLSFFHQEFNSIFLKNESSEILIHLNSSVQSINKEVLSNYKNRDRVNFIDHEANAREFKLLIPVLFSKAKLRQNQNQESKGNFISPKVKNESNKDLSSLLACGMAHDVNNILTAIQGRVWYLEKMASIQDSSNFSITPKQAFLDVSRWILKIKTLLKQLIVLTKDNAFKQQKICLNEVLTSGLELASSLVCDTVKLTLHLPDSKYYTNGDATLLEQVILNICINAKNAISENGMLEIKLRPKVKFENTNYYVISLQDNGKGIKKSHLENIFDPFFSVQQGSKGYGLGLFMCKQIIEKHNGFIEVESEEYVGTIFKIYLPVSKSSFLKTKVY
ncbi:MAG: hypothetical protein COB02_16825 [Candidatus Cloacimonadota bacterium]|nr:MAG: hypothetical protein COB02_16825 [Candidatus Cloacimonadota bacterium]